ncbi:MAG: 50S ribosomal protein L29 [Candidatus Schekmanbacteria bacterium]|nr:MAG: 50S ribosomal protein L29 [Candidatus Schekmanbacteria bacterium]
MKAKELRELTDEELKRKETDLREEIFNLRFRNSSGQVESPSKIRAAKKDLARVLTILRERQLNKKKELN